MANIQRMTAKRLGEIFTHSGLVTEEQLEEALADQGKTGKKLGTILVSRGYVTERDVAEAIATQFALPYLSPTQYFIPGEMSKAVPIEVMRREQLVPIDRIGKVLMVVIAGPVENDVIEKIEADTSSTLQVYVGTISEVKEAIDKLEDAGKVKHKKPDEDVPPVAPQ